MPRTRCFSELLAGHDGEAAIAAPGRPTLSYAGLQAQIDYTVSALNARGIGRNDRVAIVLPNGPEMAASFLAVGSGATTAPLNPAYRKPEFQFYLDDLGAKALMVEEGTDSEAVSVARELGMEILEITVDPAQPAGVFQFLGEEGGADTGGVGGDLGEGGDSGECGISGECGDSGDGGGENAPGRASAPAPDSASAPAPDSASAPAPDSVSAPAPDSASAPAPDSASTPAPERAADPVYAEPDDIALMLHTSGTTSRPKIVPLSQANVCASAGNIADALALTSGDRCVNVMPLFHIHGLMAALLATMSSGACIFCTPGFNALKFFSWLREADPTWYTAVPTMHQAILARAGRNQHVIDAVNLRFVRSSSSSLPPQVMAELEETFGAPVIEAYGMTEASHQMASNPLPPRARKPGTVGVAAGPEVSIMDEAGALLPSGSVGEIVIRGPNVTAGYENNPEANASAFAEGPNGAEGSNGAEGEFKRWFRTGDQGFMDAEGYLTITGRLKEIINRGGEKISPREVDEVLMDHPAVQQVVTFAVKHEKLGEEVAAAAVLREGAEATGRELSDYAATRLAAFKVPRTVLILDEIPKGATGKLQRIGLAKKLGLEE